MYTVLQHTIQHVEITIFYPYLFCFSSCRFAMNIFFCPALPCPCFALLCPALFFPTLSCSVLL